jgi:hypothetical protein
MRYLIFRDEDLLGSSALEERDDGMGVAWGKFFPTPEYETVRPVFKQFWNAMGSTSKETRDPQLLGKYYAERDELALRLTDKAGRRYQTTWIHIVDPDDPELMEVSVQIADLTFWVPK